MTDDDKFEKELAEAFDTEEAVENPVTPEAEKELDKEPEVKKEDEEEQKPEVKEPEEPAPAPAPEEPVKEEEPQPLTKQDITEILNQIRTEERTSTQSLESATNDVLEAYYPEGLSNVLTDATTGKELRTPQDVVEASNGEMSIEQAAQWLTNEQYKLDQSLNKIREDARTVAETTMKFRNDSVEVLTRYGDLFKAYPQLQTKVFDKMMKWVKIDEEKNVVLQAPDVMEFYDDYLEPYRLAYEFAKNKPATNPTPVQAPEPEKPGISDRLDEGGDGGQAPVNDPTDFAQQVTKELARGL